MHSQACGCAKAPFQQVARATSRFFESLRIWAGLERDYESNFCLGVILSFVAGATNAGGFLAVGQYTSHMTGMASSIADNLVTGHYAVVWWRWVRCWLLF